MPNPVMQFQIFSSQPDHTANFYATVFDWSISASNPMGYREIDTGSGAATVSRSWRSKR